MKHPLLDNPPTLAPQSAEELAEMLRDASAQGQPIVPWGAGTLQHLGRAPSSEAQLLATGALDHVLEYNPADLTITLEAGVALGAVQATLREHGQWLPWDPPAPERATAGGLLAAGASGPLRLGYGTPRDWVLGMRVALGDGRLVKSGGKVVKNVAGYDTHKLQIGALGTLGVIVAATLKVAPLPEQVESLVFACESYAHACAVAEQVRARPLAPVSLVVGDGAAGVMLAARFAGVAPAVARQVGAAQALAAAMGAAALDLGGDAWPALAGIADPAFEPAAGVLIVRAGAPAAVLGGVLAALRSEAPGGTARVAGYAGVGLAYARWEVSAALAERVAASLAKLRAALAPLGGYAVVEHAPAPLHAQLDLWGDPPATLALMRGLKAQWDPQAILNRGRYVGGI